MTLEELVLDTTNGKNTALRSVVRPLPLVGPGSGPESAGAKLVFLGELSSDDGKANTVLDILLEVFELGYTPPKNQQSLAPVALFEKAVGSVNQALSSLAAEGHVGWVGSLHVVLALVSETEIHLTRAGEARTFLLRGPQFIDVLRGQTTPADNPLKTFGTIISGKLEPGDRVMISTPQLFDFLSNEKIRRVLSERSPDMAKMEFESLLSPEGTPDGSVGLLLFERPGTPAVSTAPRQPTAKKSEAKSTPPTSGEAPSANTPVHARRGQTTVKSPVIAPERTDSQNAPSPGAMFRSVTKGVSGAATRSATLLKSIRSRNKKQTVSSGSPVVPQPKLSASPARVAPNVLHQMKRFVARIRRLPRVSQGLLGGAVVLVVVLIVSLSLNSTRQETEQITAANSELVTSVQQDIKRASDTLLFRDEATALSLLVEAEGRLNNEVIPSEAASDEEVQLLQTSIADVYDQIDKITRLDDLTASVAIDNLSPVGLVEVGSERLFFTETDVYGSSDAGNLALRATQPDGTTEPFVRAFQDADGGRAILLGSSGSLFSYDPETDALALIDGTASPDTVQGGALYNGNLYLIDQSENQILKHRPAGSGFGSGTGWISDAGVSLATATDLAIDGDIFVLSENGTVEKFLSGSRQDFALSTPSEAYSKATHIATGSDASRLVVLDPASSRLGVFDKTTGELVAQYQADVFSSALDVFLNAAGSQATVLTPEGIYEVGL